VDQAEVNYLYDLATSAFWGPPKPPPAFAIANLVNGANNGSVDPRVISEVLYEIAITFDPPTVGVFPSPDGNPDGVGSIFLDIAGEAADEATKELVTDFTKNALSFLPGNLSQVAGNFLGGFTGGVLDDVVTGKLSGDSVLYDVARGVLAIF
jgi:hypothetical protein